MNSVIIILGVIVVFLAYQLYTIYTSVPVIANKTYLGDATSTVTFSPPSQSDSAKYTMAFWMYVGTFSADIGKFLVFGKGKTTDDSQNVCEFSIEPSAPKLHVVILTGSTTQDIVITNNFPLQTWTYVTVSVSTVAGSYADCYINGKLVVSQQLKESPTSLTVTANATDADKPSIIMKKSSGVDVYLTKITWLPYPVDPQTVWGYYNQGSGEPKGQGVTSAYHLNVNLSKDSNNFTWKLF